MTEDFRVESLSDDNLVRLAPAGFVHLDLLKSATYLAAIAEDTAFPTEEIAKRVTARIGALEDHYNIDTVIANARDVVGFFSEQRDKILSSLDAIIDRDIYEQLSDLSDIPEAINALERSVAGATWTSVAQRYPLGRNVMGTVVNVRDFGVFAELEPGITGLIHASRLPLGFANLGQFAYRERIIVQILGVYPVKKRVELAYVGTPLERMIAGVGQLTLDLLSDSNPEQMV